MGINFQDVSFKYSKKASKSTLSNINLNINEKNEFIFIVGHTGSGKTTLVQHLNALLYPTDGKLYFNNELVKKGKSVKHIRSQVGLVFQFPEYQLFEETVIKDVMFGPKNFGKTPEEAKEAAIKSCELVRLPKEIYEKSPFALSGGQMRRVAIAGVLASNPDILVLDEPTVGLDPKGKLELLQLLEDIRKETNKTIIVISHDMNIVAKHATRVIVLSEGNIVFDGSTKELFNNPTLINRYSLDLPNAAKLASELKLKGLIDYESIPLSKEELLELIKTGDRYE